MELVIEINFFSL